MKSILFFGPLLSVEGSMIAPSSVRQSIGIFPVFLRSRSIDFLLNAAGAGFFRKILI